MTIIASLPPALLWGASFAASNDFTKGRLCAIDIRKQDATIRIVSVDGHRCFRCYLPASEAYFAPETDCIRLSPKAFSKAPSRKSVAAEIDDGGIVFFKDKNGNVLSSSSWIPEPWAVAEYTFPNIDQIWPEEKSLSCKPGQFVAMKASYVADFAKVAAKISSNNIVRMLSTDHAISPMVWQCVFDNEWLSCEEKSEIWLQYLLMPVQVRQ